MTTQISTRAQSSQVKQERQERQRGVRREASSKLLVCADRFYDIADELRGRLADKSSLADDYRENHVRFLDQWREVLAASATVQVTGPTELKDAAASLREALAGLYDVCDGWYDAREQGQPNGKPKDFNEARANYAQERTGFLDIAQCHVA